METNPILNASVIDPKSRELIVNPGFDSDKSM